jgi:quercetin dioxygenase-like cupin family protein
MREVVFTEADTLGKTTLCAIQTVPPGCSIGIHTHDPDVEIFHVLSGTIRVIDNGVEKDLVAGDSNFSGRGGSHGVVNVSDKDAVMLCIVIK